MTTLAILISARSAVDLRVTWSAWD
ncbi:hypothetical protein MESS2_1060001 [Mesorhizobium metallidurans STM 2683]|uniref:Uncharacterized protein n=1 Tax=Mesorhizobium metallidurans STM 2683 TaxID=1297569 RepID=M5EGS4_9HYPH|nr:hypothetical protein MESS2_1060001 [Mesorhizobium metallidurans STM 2683]